MTSFGLSLIINIIITLIILIRYLYIGITIKSLIIRITAIFIINHLIIRTFYYFFKKIVTEQNILQKEKVRSNKIEPLVLEKIDTDKNDGKVIISKKIEQ